MKNKKIVIAGGSGFIGQELVRYFGKANEMIVLTRAIPGKRNNRNKQELLTAAERRHTQWVQWDGKTQGAWAGQLEKADILINLTGKTVNCRYTPANRQVILDSRVEAVKALGEAVRRCAQPPALWINASSATIYRHATDRPQDEYTGEFQDGFSVQVCREWEQAFYAQAAPATRKAALRMAITLGTGGVLVPYFNLLKAGLGGHQGSGRQMYSWIHIADTCRIIDWLYAHPEQEGTFNCASPTPVTNAAFMKALRQATGNRFGLHTPAWMLRLGARLIGTETELVLKSRWVIPTRLQAAGFEFKYPFLPAALSDIVSRIPRRQYRLF